MEAWQSVDLAGLLCGGLVKQLSGKSAELGSGGLSGGGPCEAGFWWAQWAGGMAEWSGNSVVLWGGGLVGRLFF
jgi:hypothetical protein